MDGEYNGKPYEQMDDLGGKTTIFGNTFIAPGRTLQNSTSTYHLSIVTVHQEAQKHPRGWAA